MFIKVAQKGFSSKMKDFDKFTKMAYFCDVMAIWAKELMPRTLKSCSKCYKSANLVTLNLSLWKSTHNSFSIQRPWF